jgi:hypothetical protein
MWGSGDIVNARWDVDSWVACFGNNTM